MQTSVAMTDVGRVRKVNQDYVYASDTPVGNLPNLYIVADGMGGHKQETWHLPMRCRPLWKLSAGAWRPDRR